jgi:hypothetical protein
MEKGTKDMDGMSDYVEYSTSPGRISYIQYAEDRAVEKDSFVMTEELMGPSTGRNKASGYHGFRNQGSTER